MWLDVAVRVIVGEFEAAGLCRRLAGSTTVGCGRGCLKLAVLFVCGFFHSHMLKSRSASGLMDVLDGADEEVVVRAFEGAGSSYNFCQGKTKEPTCRFLTTTRLSPFLPPGPGGKHCRNRARIREVEVGLSLGGELLLSVGRDAMLVMEGGRARTVDFGHVRPLVRMAVAGLA